MNIINQILVKIAAEIKGVISYENLQKKPWYQPCCGTNAVKLNGHRAWKREQIIKWLSVDDSNLRVRKKLAFQKRQK